ncbi:MAG: hypothetical protein IJ590_02905 [Rickettsiales bacterium]|nr:hypothetical protein [Rickettsiales bacterium]
MVCRKSVNTLLIIMIFGAFFLHQHTVFADETQQSQQQSTSQQPAENKTENSEVQQPADEVKEIKEEKLVPRPNNVPPFPEDNSKLEIKLADNGFTNNINPMYYIADKNDIFVDTHGLYAMNNRYIAGNEDDITQIDAMMAEKCDVMEYHGHKREDNQVTHRTRVLAYLTKDQVAFGPVFSKSPHGYYYNAVKEKMDKRKK